uniref:Uncharacterized protein n=1 Tax=Avena sativa TaxID=4498 RepID=A0ACD5XJY7_AVESA
MKLVVGSPGTWSGMALRVSQFVFAGASMCAMVTAPSNSNYSAFFYMNFTMGLQLLWSLGLACVDIFTIRNKKDLHNWEIVSLIVFGDWIMSVFAFSGVCASASLMILFAEDMNFCRIYWRLPCDQFVLSITMASIVWSLDAASSLSGFWLLVSFF